MPHTVPPSPGVFFFMNGLRPSAADLQRLADAAYCGGPREGRSASDGRCAPTATPQSPEACGCKLTAQQQTIASAMFTRMAQPLSADEQKICAQLDISEEDYLRERNLELVAGLPVAAGLEASELEVCRSLGVTPEAFAAEKARR